MKANTKHQKRQRGSALILVLGILSLVLVMGMAFAFTARTNRQVAQINADIIKTRLQNESALNWVLAVLKFEGPNEPYIGKKFTKEINFPKLADNPEDQEYCFINGVKYNFTTKYYVQGGNGFTMKSKTHFTPQAVFNGNDDNNNDDEDDDKFAYDILLKQSSGYISKVIAEMNPPSFDSTTGKPNDDLSFWTLKDNDKVIGRYAFLVLEDTAKFDLNEILTFKNNTSKNFPFIDKDHQFRLAEYYNAAFDSKDFYYNILGDYDTTSRINYGTNSAPQKVPTFRLGNSPRELRLPYRASFFNPLAASGGDVCLRPWMSYEHLNEKVEDTKDNFTNKYYSFLYTFYSGEEPEAYYYLDGTTVTECARFDLTGYEWRDTSSSSNYYDADNKPTGNGSWDHDTGDYTASDLVNYLTGTDKRHDFWKNDSARNEANIKAIAMPGDSGFGIPWLHDSDSQTQIVKKQIAANLIDYCDNDSDPTTPDGFSFDDLLYEDGSKDPEFFGNEQVPYLNELAITANLAMIKISAEDFTPEQYEIKFNLTPKLEVVNIFPQGLYDDNIEYSCKLYLFGKVQRTDTTTPLYNFSEKDNAICIVSEVKRLAKDMDFYTFTFNNTPTDLPLSNPEIWVNDSNDPNYEAQYEIKISRVVLTLHEGSSSTPPKDIAVWTGDATIFEHNDNQLKDQHVPLITRYSNLEAQDPRANYKHGYTDECWAWRDGLNSSKANDDDTNWTLEEKNSNFWVDSRDENMDLEESGVTFKKDSVGRRHSYSTAYISNAPMESLWELGVIPTGEIGKTINLTKESTDALLDQVKIGPLKLIRGKFNANTRNPGAVQHLLEGIYADWSTSSPFIELKNSTDQYTLTMSNGDNWATSWVDPGDPDKIIPILTDYDDSTPPVTSFNRGKAARQLLGKISGNDANTNDLLQEQYIGRTVNLLSTRYEIFTVVIVAQSLKELQNLASEDNDTEIESAFNNIRQTMNNPILYDDGTLEKHLHICEILGTQVMQVQVLRDTWLNKFSVVQRQIIGN